MKSMDVIMLSYAKTDKLKQITQQAVETLCRSKGDTTVHITVVESQKSLKPYEYDSTTTRYYDIPFNYNKYMNIAFEEGKSEYVAFCNNDLIFIDKWADNIIKYMEEYELDSASPMCPLHHGNQIINEPVVIGHQVGVELAGWCIVVKRKFFEDIGGFDDYVDFYASDNVYEQQLINNNARHGLVTRSSVVHLRSKTLETIKYRDKLTVENLKKYNKTNNTNLYGVGNGN